MTRFCFFSSVGGQVSIGDLPIMGAQVTRGYKSSWFHTKEVQETVYTDSEGKFAFGSAFAPMSFGSFVASILPHEPVIHQYIIVAYQGVKYDVWIYTKGDYSENTESPGGYFYLRCDLLSKAENKEKFYGIGIL